MNKPRTIKTMALWCSDGRCQAFRHFNFTDDRVAMWRHAR